MTGLLRVPRNSSDFYADIVTVVPEHERDTLEDVTDVAKQSHVVLLYLSDVKSRVTLVPLLGEAASVTVPLPNLCDGIGQASVSAQPEDSEFFVSFHSFAVPSVISRIKLDGMGMSSQQIYEANVSGGADLRNFKVEQVFVPSKDGTRVPAFVVSPRDRDTSDDGERQSLPTLLYGYGGFDISLTPAYSFTAATWVARGPAVMAGDSDVSRSDCKKAETTQLALETDVGQDDNDTTDTPSDRESPPSDLNDSQAESAQ
ncbi:MAG: hypothetical protein MHM6MM_009092 [Cercozoa sp. M6MM]